MKRAIVVTGAVGDIEPVEEVLQRFGFAAPVEVPTLEAALARLDAERQDLLLIPLASAGAMDLAALEREIRQREGTFVIGTAARAEPELILQAMRAGVHEFLLSPPDPNELAAAVDRLMRRGDQELRQGQVLAVYSAKGGLGTTTVAMNLAFALARQDPTSRVALADLVVAGGDVRVMLNLKTAYDIGDLLARIQRVDADLLTSMLSPVEGGVWVLPAAERPEVAEMVDAAATTTMIEHLRSYFGHVVLDCEHHLTERTLAALDVADAIVLVTQLNIPSIRSTQRTLELARRLGYPQERLRIVVNRHHAGDVLSLSDAADLLGHAVYFHLPNDYKGSTAAQAKGASIVSLDPGSKLTAAYNALAAKLAGAGVPARNGKARSSDSRISRLFGFGRK